MENYKITGRIGEGAHGVILRGRQLANNREVALKKVMVKNIEDGIPSQIIREIKTMQIADSKYVMRLLDFFPQGVSFVLVFEYMPSGLSEIIYDFNRPMTESQIKSYTIMLLRGVEHLHEKGIMHRDLKPANLLIGEDGVLRIGDFGLARMMWSGARKERSYTHQIATRWYRPPEILYGSRHYTQAVDIWAVGCIFAEMLNKSPLFPGETDIDQLAMVIRYLGTPNETIWPGLTSLPDYNKITFPTSRAIPWESLLPDVSEEGVELAKSFMLYDSNKRISAKKALMHPYFCTAPMPLAEREMPRPPKDHREMLKSKEAFEIKTCADIYDELGKMFKSAFRLD